MEETGTIYALEALKGKKRGWRYIGQTIDFRGRTQTHYSQLRRNVHSNAKLQRYYNKYGKKSLKLVIIGKYTRKSLNFWENFFVSHFDCIKNGFNILPGGEERPETQRKRSCIMQNIFTNEVVETDSLTDFARKYNLSIGNLCSTIKGKINYCGDWFSPENKWRPKFHDILDPNGKLYKVLDIKVRDFEKEHNLPDTTIYRLISGKAEFGKGWSRPNSSTRCARNRLTHYKVQSPTGEIIEGKNTSKFEREHGLTQGLLYHALKNRSPRCKTWKLIYD